MELEVLLEQDVHSALPSLDDVLNDIKETAAAAMRYLKKGVSGILVALMLGSMPINAQASFPMTNQSYEIVVDNKNNDPIISGISEACPNHYKIQQRILELKSLKDNWDGYGAMTISEDALSMTGSFAEVLSEEVLGHCSVFPAANSDVYLQGKFPKGSLIVTFSNERMTYVLKGENIDKHSANKVPLYRETVSKLNGIIVDNLMA